MSDPGGRPTTYTRAMADAVCQRLAAGESLLAISHDPAMPAYSTIYSWAIDDRDDFAARYARARDIYNDYLADRVIAIADGSGDADADVARDRLRFDARRWYLSKLAPKRYGDKQTHEVSGPDGAAIPTATTLNVAFVDPEPCPDGGHD